jgi:glycosyltransferase involved in cell wall biosynthesis
MKIAQIAPLMESVPPRLYGGTERVVSYLTEELVGLGHDVTLFASGDSITEAAFVPCCKSALRLEAEAHDPIPHYIVMLHKLMRVAHHFDVLHFHIDYLHFPQIGGLESRAVTTLHGRQDLPANAPFYRYFRNTPLVSISHAQRAPISYANFIMACPSISIAPNLIREGAILRFSDAFRPKRIRFRPSALRAN